MGVSLHYERESSSKISVMPKGLIVVVNLSREMQSKAVFLNHS